LEILPIFVTFQQLGNERPEVSYVAFP